MPGRNLTWRASPNVLGSEPLIQIKFTTLYEYSYLPEVWECSATEAIGDTLALNILLADASNDLRDVDVVT